MELYGLCLMKSTECKLNITCYISHKTTQNAVSQRVFAIDKMRISFFSVYFILVYVCL